jgi:hypothetical protein
MGISYDECPAGMIWSLRWNCVKSSNTQSFLRVLFTTTEMLNQRMGDDRFRHLFGIGERAQRPVEMMLLDEVHMPLAAIYRGSLRC